MTDQEFDKLLNHLYVTFPSIREFVLKNSPDAEATERKWRAILAPYALIDCAMVIDHWATGRRKGFEAYQRDQIALMIKQSIEHDRAKATEVNGSDERRFEFSRSLRGDRRLYLPIESNNPGMAATLQAGRKLMSARDKGEISDSEFLKRKQELLNALAQ